LLERLAHHAFELADIGLDRSLARRSAGVAFTLLRFDPELVVRLLLEGFERAGQRADLVAAIGIAGIDGKVARGDLEHGVAHIVQRFDDPAGDHQHGATGQGNRCDQERQLEKERAQRQ